MNGKFEFIKFDQGEISSTSIVNEYVKLGQRSQIWHFCNVYGASNGEVTIGEDTRLGGHSEVKPFVQIGNHCRLQYGQFIPDHTTIGNHVFIGPRVTFLNDKYPSSYKSTDRSLEKLLATSVNDSACIGGGAVIGPGITIGKYCLIGMGAVVTNCVPDFSIVAGNPARVIGEIYEDRFIKHYPEFRSLIK